jgi:DNA-binding PadR family transcriptional regulator
MQANRPERSKSASAARRAGAQATEDLGPASAWLVLALLIEQPSHGYELSQRYKRRFGELLPMSVPRVYGALERLRETGLIEPVAPRRGRSASKQELMRRSYRATSEGTRAYRRWLAERMQDDPQRPELLARIVSAGLLNIDAVLEVIDHYQRECIEELRALPAHGERLETGGASLEEVTRALVVDQRRRELAARNDWATYARQALQAHAAAASKRGSQPEEAA